MDKEFYRRDVSEIIEKLDSNIEQGLSTDEVRRRLGAWGYNEFKKHEHTSLLQKFVAQFKSFMIIVLIVAAIISGVTGYMNGEGITDAIIILVIIVINALIGVFQEAKAEKSLAALEKLSAPHCKVVRNGEVVVIESRELVVGDIVVIETGDSVPADLRLIEATNLKIQEASLTGESLPVEKSVAVIDEELPIGDRTNMAFASSSVTYGRGRGIVVATGENSEVGKIASMIQSVPDMKTPMQMRLYQLGKALAIISLVICGAIFIIGMLYGNGFLEMFMTAVSLAVAAIPEGLPAVSTIVLAIGVQRLAKQNAITRNLPSVETLGSTTVICSDKTGTLTQNKMTVTKICGESDTLIKVAMLANDATSHNEDGKVAYIGDPTETALLDMGARYNLDKAELERTMPRVAEIPFDSERKRMTTVHPTENGLLVAVKGGLDEGLESCTRILENDGSVREIKPADIERLRAENTAMAESALRVLAMAKRNLNTLPDEMSVETIERDLVFLGMVGMIDPPREEVRAAVSDCKTAGIKPVMITGDHKITATAIARDLGIMEEDDAVLTGIDVEKMSDEELSAIAAHTSVFARVAPEHKVRIVKAFQSQGNVVAMTGDGVNDAPALKLANIGVAMGITGTDVSKEAADVVLADDNFSTIVTAVREGRRIYDNLIKSIQFMISTNLGEIILLLVAVICNFDVPLLPIQLLWINLVTDSLPALALSVDPASRDIMQRKPIDPKAGILTRHFITVVAIQSLIIGGMSLAAYMIGLEVSVETARTMTFATLAFSQMTMIFSIRSGNHSALNGMFANKYLWGAILLVVAAMLCVLLIPQLQPLFKVVSLDAVHWYWVIGLSFGGLLLSEVLKIFRR